MPETTQRVFTTLEVAQRTGATARQLQWWDEQRIVVPGRDGARRVYSYADLSEVLVIEQLRMRHISLQRIRKVVRFLRKEFGERMADVVAGSVDHHLLLDGNRIYLETSDKQVVDVVKNARQPVFVICLSDAVRKLRVEELPSLRKARAVASIRKTETRSKAS